MIRRLIAATLLVVPTSAWGQLYVRRPLQLAQQNERVTTTLARHDCGMDHTTQTCGEVEALLPVNTAHVASITPIPLTNGPHRANWQPSVWCAAAPIRSNSHTCYADADGRLLWHIAGKLDLNQKLQPGHYQGAAILAIQGSEEIWTVRVPVMLNVLDPQPSCVLSGDGHLDFGHVEGLQANAITLDPVRASHSAWHSKVSNTGYAFANMTVHSPGNRVSVTVQAPSELTSAGAAVRFTSMLAYRSESAEPWVLLLTGSGSRTVANAPNQALRFRLGGMVHTSPGAPEAHYSGAITVSFHCEPNG